ncbi:hypothetical protein FY557_17600 [Chryseobacterium sp. SN22]|uniref:hypothetical protein n=1 Tax=Chryseobacterium sp. SN22 TaxID=2606431 RepID=UPI0011EF38B7|nr:hypothetical protein [Chryseobacterium sp. SN22]KAA0126465.1 hypothetical protein FY557_17600 [Chryseobacterium sp. SN22]
MNNLSKEQLKELLETQAQKHCKEVLGEEQYNDEEFVSAKDAIADDFKAGAMWLFDYLKENSPEV